MILLFFTEYDISGLCTCVIFNNLNFKTMPRRRGSDATDIRMMFQPLKLPARGEAMQQKHKHN